MLLGRGLPPVYERKPDDAPVPEGVAPHWRFRLDHDAPIEWDDLVRGHQKFDPALISDPVIRRADGSWLYLLPSVIDDIDLGITHIVRGEDHVSNSAVQIADVRRARRRRRRTSRTKRCWSRRRASCRSGSARPGSMRCARRGSSRWRLLSLLARLGTSQPVEAKASLAELAEGFDFATFGRAPAHFDLAEVEQLNAKLLHHARLRRRRRPPARRDRARPTGCCCAAMSTISARSADWLPVLDGDIAAARSRARRRARFLAEAADDRRDARLGGRPVARAGRRAQGQHRAQGHALFHPLRLALTGRDSGPEMAPLLRLIGRDRAIARLTAAAALKRPIAAR